MKNNFNYGLPYMGSKDKIIASIASVLPKAENFYDLFGGGGAVTHYMALRRRDKYQHFHYNEIKADVVELFKDAIAGKYNNFKPPWISRKDFFERKDRDAYIRCLWSFGNDQRTYLFGESIEEYKRSIHQAVVFGEFNELAAEVLKLNQWPTKVDTIKKRRLYLRRIIEHYRKTTIPKVLHQFLDLKQLQRLQHLERLEQLQQLQQFQRVPIIITPLSYDQVQIKDNSVIYCDPPYFNTSDYGAAFDHAKFLNWAAESKHPVFISEYDISDERFKCIYQIEKASLKDNSKDKKMYKQEKLYWNGR